MVVGRLGALIVACALMVLPAVGQVKNPVLDFQALMAHHRAVVKSLRLKSSVEKQIETLTDGYEEATKRNLQELINLKSADPFRKTLAQKIREDSERFTQSLKIFLGDKWVEYASAYSPGISTTSKSSTNTIGAHNRPKIERSKRTSKKRSR